MSPSWISCPQLVEETEFGRPDFVEDHAANGRFDDLLVRIAENGLLAEIRIRKRIRSCVLTRAIVIGELDFYPSSRTAADAFDFAGSGLRGSAVR